MNNIRALLAILSLACLNLSCSDEHSLNPSNPPLNPSSSPRSRLRQVTLFSTRGDTSSASSIYTYNLMGRVDSIQDDWGPVAFLSLLSYDDQRRLIQCDKRPTKNIPQWVLPLSDQFNISYAYSGKSAVGTRSYNSNNVTYGRVAQEMMWYAINENNQPVKMVSVSLDNYPVVTNYPVVIDTDDRDSCFYTYAQGNVTQIKKFNIHAGKITGRTETTYKYDTSLNPYYGIYREHFSEQYSRNTVTKQTEQDFDRNGKLGATRVYAYTNISDSQGRLIERKQIDPLISVGSRYTYENY